MTLSPCSFPSDSDRHVFVIYGGPSEKVLEGASQARKTKDVMIGLGFEPCKPSSEPLEGWGLEVDSSHVTKDSANHVCVRKRQ